MKKLMIAAAIVCAAALSQAATVSWSTSGLMDSEGETLTTGAGYVFSTKGNNPTTVAAVSAALEACTSASEVKTYLESNSMIALKGEVSNGLISVPAADMATANVKGQESAVKWFAVIVDDASFGDDMKYCVTALSGSKNLPKQDATQTVAFSVPGTATQTAANWQSVPEPTSGLLLLLGVAGLALRRKQK